VLVSLILLSAFFSSAETAFSSVNRIRLKNFVDEGRKGSKKALLIAENFDKTITTILIGNNIVNTAAASISAALAIQLFGNNSALVISTVMITLLIIIFGEILPKSLAKERAESYSLAISGVLFWLIKIFTPISYLFIKLKSGVTKLFKKRDLEELPSVTEEEIKTIIDISEEEGVIDKEERELIVNSMNFDDTLVEEVLTPRIDMVAISIDQSIDEVKKVFFEERYSRIPVYEDNIDNIVGILFEKDFFFHLIKYNDVNIREIMREPLFAIESMKISDLLPQLQKERLHMAIVLDEYGGTSGLITLEDILEEIVGEIWDEQDEKVTVVSQLSEKMYRFDAQFPLDDFAELVNVPLPESSYHTVGGWVLENFRTIPINGDYFIHENLKVTVEEIHNRRIRKVIVEILEKLPA
jgi:putative hemolysin